MAEHDHDLRVVAILDGWGESVRAAPPPPIPRVVRDVVRGRRAPVAGARRGWAWTAAAAAVALSALVAVWGRPSMRAAPVATRGLVPAGAMVAPTQLSLTRANRAFDPEHVRLPDAGGGAGPTERAYLARDYNEVLNQL